MSALVWKEARQQLAWFLVALATSIWLWFRAANVWDQLVRATNETALWSMAIPLLYAFALAQLQFGRDGDTRHFGLLVHRARGARGYFASKVIVGLAALAGVVVLPMTIWAVAMGLTDPDAMLIHWIRVPQTCLLCVPALLVYAVGVLSTQLRRGGLVRWGCASCGATGAFMVMWPLSALIGPGRVALLAWVGLDFVLALAVLWLARSLLLGGRDRDLGLRDGQLAGVAGVAFLILLPIAAFVLGTAESSALRAVVAEKPAILRDPGTGEVFAAVQSESGWQRRDGRADGLEIAQDREDFFHIGRVRQDLLHYSGSPRVMGVDRVRECVEQWTRCRSEGDAAPRARSGYVPQMAAVRTQGEPRPEPVEHWTVQCELDADDGAVHIDVSRAADGLPPLQFTANRPGGRFSEQAGFVEFRPHAPLVLDRADGTLWRIRLREDGAQAVSLELPGGDRVRGLEPLFQRDGAILGRFEQHFSTTGESRSDYLFVGGKGEYVLFDGKIVPFSEDSRPKDAVTIEEGARLARYAVVSNWPDAFTEEIRVEELSSRTVLLDLRAEPGTRAARRCAAIYSALAFVRTPASVVGERCGGLTTNVGLAAAPAAEERQLFAQGRHPLLFALVMLFGAFQLFLGWRWLARAGVGMPTRVVYMLLILVGGVVALLLTWLLLPRHVRSSPRLERQGGLEPLTARA